MSQLHRHPVTLELLLSRFQLAVVARVAQTREERTALGATHPDFVSVLQRLEVTACLTPGGPQAGDVIEVESANTAAMRRMHSEYYLRGLSRSPLLECFEGAPLEPGTEVIALLHSAGARFAWVVDVSCLPLSARPQVERAIAQR